MGTGYTRQALANIQDDQTIEASDINAELNQLEDAFDLNSGHTHDGTTGEGPKIDLTTSISQVLPVAHGGIAAISKIDATTNPTVNDDSGDGYGPGSVWINVTSDIAYICLDATVGAAVWDRISYTENLDDISNLSNADDNFIVGDGTGWEVQTPNTVRNTLGLGTSDDVIFSTVTAGTATITNVNASGNVTADILYGASTINAGPGNQLQLYQLSGDSIIKWGSSGDNLKYDQSADMWTFEVSNVDIFTLDSITADFQSTHVTTTGTVTADRITIDDANFELYLASADVVIEFDSITDSLQYDRTANQYAFKIGSTDELTLNATTADFQSNDITTTGDVSAAKYTLDSGFEFYVSSGTPVIELNGTADSIQYNRTSNLVNFYIASGLQFTLSATQADFYDNNIVTTGTLSSGNLTCGSITASGAIDAGSNNITTTGDLSVDNITSTGVITQDDVPAFSANKNGAAQSAAGTAEFGTAHTNNGSHYSTSTYRFTAPVAGVYRFACSLLAGFTSASSGVLFFRFYKNGAQAGPTYHSSSLTSTQAYQLVSGEVILDLAVNDYVEVYAVPNANSQVYTSAFSNFSGNLIG